MVGPAPVPDSVGHQDHARAKVSSTAIAVAALRAFESRKAPGDRLFCDPLAEVLVGSDRLAKVEFWKATGQPKEFWVDFLAARTRWLDDKIGAAAAAVPELQVVIVGAGLDTRAYRLEGLRGRHVFEVDFEEVLAAKQSILDHSSPPPEPLARRTLVAADLSSGDKWRSALLAAGFCPERPSLWLLEGLTGYLTEQELHRLLKDISTLAAEGSQMLATFVGEGMRQSQEATPMHRYFVQNEAEISDLLLRHGWVAGSISSLETVAALYGRVEHIPEGYSYYLAEAMQDPSAAQSML